MQRRQVGGGEGPARPVAHRDEQRDGLGVDAAPDEGEHVGGRRIEPVRVLDHEQQRRARRDVAEQVERRERDQERVGRLGLRHAERGQQRVAPARRQRVRGAEHGAQQLVQAGEGEPRLRLHARGAQHAQALVLRYRDRARQQRRLADPGLPADDERTAAGPGPVQQRRDRVKLEVAPDQGHPRASSSAAATLAASPSQTRNSRAPTSGRASCAIQQRTNRRSPDGTGTPM